MTGSSTSTGRFAFPLFTLLEGLEQLPSAMMAAAKMGSGHVRTEAASTFRLDRLFDIFFESYWRRYAGLDEVALTGTLTGRAWIEIRRRDALSGQEETLSSTEFDVRGQVIVVPIALKQPSSDQDANYLVAILHLADGAELHDLRWCTTAAPVRQVCLAGVICTFNREDMLAANLARFEEAAPFLHRLFVVNQGVPNLAKRMDCGTGLQSQVTYIDQPNFGGAGGFTRGIIESMDDPDITHVLLMDDDIDACPNLLARMATVLAYTSDRHCIGGAMLDIHHPSTLFTCGDQLHPARPAIINIAPDEGNRDVTTDAGRDFVARHHRLDFNGWWCFAFPIEAVKQCGLPLPLFIRGDDVEFGFRLSRAGFPTLGWPGIAVWHVPFQLKVQPWQAFYDRRNMLFLNEAHTLHSRRRMARSAWGSLSNALKSRDYPRARAVVEGVEAFNKGASQLAKWRGEDHSELRRRVQGSHPAEDATHTPSRDWINLITILARGFAAMAALRWFRRPDRGAISRLSQLDSWREYLNISGQDDAMRNKGFAAKPDDSIAFPQQVK